jgi:hypothetical protein
MGKESAHEGDAAAMSCRISPLAKLLIPAHRCIIIASILLVSSERKLEQSTKSAQFEPLPDLWGFLERRVVLHQHSLSSTPEQLNLLPNHDEHTGKEAQRSRR